MESIMTVFMISVDLASGNSELTFMLYLVMYKFSQSRSQQTCLTNLGFCWQWSRRPLPDIPSLSLSSSPQTVLLTGSAYRTPDRINSRQMLSAAISQTCTS